MSRSEAPAVVWSAPGSPPSGGFCGRGRRSRAPRRQQHADTWRVDTENPATSVVVRQFPAGDPAPSHEQRVLRALDGLAGLAPVWLGGKKWGKKPHRFQPIPADLDLSKIA